MRTSVTSTAISYMPSNVLEERLDALQSAGLVDFYGFIPHKGEVLNFGVLQNTENSLVPVKQERDKDHIHLILQPAKILDLSSISDDIVDGLACVDPDHPDLPPLRCTGWRKCKSFSDWYFYNLHFEPYLSSKMEVKEFHYSPADFVWSDLSVAQMMIEEAVSQSKFAKQLRIRQALESGKSISDLAYSGVISPEQAFAYKNFESLFFTGKRSYEARKTAEELENLVTDGKISFSDYLDITEEKEGL